MKREPDSAGFFPSLTNASGMTDVPSVFPNAKSQIGFSLLVKLIVSHGHPDMFRARADYREVTEIGCHGTKRLRLTIFLMHPSGRNNLLPTRLATT